MANIRFPSYKSSVVELKGGINENVSSLELLAGELIDCKNYMVSESAYGGYTSIKGYERFDGVLTPSLIESYVLTIGEGSIEVLSGQTITSASGTAVALADGVLLSGSYAGGDAVSTVEALVGAGLMVRDEAVSTVSGLVGTLKRVAQLTGGTVDYHLALDYARTQVLPVPGEGPILGVHILDNKVYAFRKKTSVAFVGMYVEDATGWLEIDTSANPIAYGADCFYRFVNYNFFAGTQTNSMYWVDGCNACRAYDGTTVTVISNTGMGALDKPIHIAAHNFYLFLAYRGSSLQYSALGLPADWTTPGEIGTGAEITNLIAGVKSSLIVYLTEGIKILNGTVDSEFSFETFSLRSGALPSTAQRAFGTVYSIDDRGLTTLQASDTFGDYAASSISQKFKNTLLDPRHKVINTTVSRDLNQYRIFFDDAEAIFVSFDGTELKGATLIEYDRIIKVIAQGEDTNGRSLIVFGTTDSEGYVYKMDSGPSFDGIEIITRLSTAYFHYGSPRTYKTFKRATLEVRGEGGQTFAVKINFDYLEPGTATSSWKSASVYAGGGVTSVWGEAVWGEFVWGQLATATNRLAVYLQGVGTNASYRIISKEMYRQQHTIQNIISDYEVNGRSI